MHGLVVVADGQHWIVVAERKREVGGVGGGGMRWWWRVYGLVVLASTWARLDIGGLWFWLRKS